MSRHLAPHPPAGHISGILLCVLLPWLLALPARAAITVTDDSGREVRLETPARRVIALSPHTAELMFAVGMGGRLVATVAHADYPPAAARLPRIGDAYRLDREALVALAPDLVLAWPSGNPTAVLQWIEARGIPIYRSDPQTLEGIAGNLADLGRLSGEPERGRAAANAFLGRLQRLRTRFRNLRARPRRLFYLLWGHPLMTLGKAPLFSEALAVCGLVNVFGGEASQAFAVSQEAVIRARPQVILVTPSDTDAPPPLPDQHPGWSALTHGHLIQVPADLLQRPTPRILDGIERLCTGRTAEDGKGTQ